MSPDDPRHGTEAGSRAHYRAGERPCPPCLDAHRRRNTMRQLYPHKRPSLGSQRRIQALQAIGWSRGKIAAELGYTDHGALTYLMNSDTMLATTAERIAEVYERLSMQVPEGSGPRRARTWAKRHGYAPPLAWDDIDTDPEPHCTSGATVTPLRERTWDTPDHRACPRCGVVRKVNRSNVNPRGDLCRDCLETGAA